MSAPHKLGPGIRYSAPTYVDKAGRSMRATARQELVIGKLVENTRNETPMTLGAVLVEAGYSPKTAISPNKVIESRGFQELLEEMLPDDELTAIHLELLRSKKLDHMVFPLGPAGEDDENFSGAEPNKNQVEEAGVYVERTTLSDAEITAMLKDVGGTVRRIVHGDTARHVYFWAPNDKARQDALKLAYELKGRTGKNVQPIGPISNTYNTYVQNNTLNPNEPKGRQIIDVTLDTLMEVTKRKVIDG